jgi:hypothetical protein
MPTDQLELRQEHGQELIHSVDGKDLAEAEKDFAGLITFHNL